jgi:hypothetical protein
MFSLFLLVTVLIGCGVWYYLNSVFEKKLPIKFGGEKPWWDGATTEEKKAEEDEKEEDHLSIL